VFFENQIGKEKINYFRSFAIFFVALGYREALIPVWITHDGSG